MPVAIRKWDLYLVLSKSILVALRFEKGFYWEAWIRVILKVWDYRSPGRLMQEREGGSWCRWFYVNSIAAMLQVNCTAGHGSVLLLPVLFLLCWVIDELYWAMLSYVELHMTYVIYAFVLCSMRTSFPPPLGVILGKSLIKAFCERTSGRLQAKAAGFAHLAAVTIRHVPPFSPFFIFCCVLLCCCAAGQRSFSSFSSCSWISRYALPSCGLITPHFLLILPTPLENKCLVTPSKLQPGDGVAMCRQLGFSKCRAASHLSAPAPRCFHQHHRTPPLKITNVVSHKQSLK